MTSILPAAWSVAAIASRQRLRRCASVGPGARALGRIWIHGEGQVVLGARVTLDASHVPIELHAMQPTSRIVIGDDVFIGGGTSIEASEQVTISDRCSLGPFVKVLDNHFHPLRGNRHQRPMSAAVHLEHDVVVEARAIILPGTYLEAGARIGVGTVVSRRVPGGANVSGLPATRRNVVAP